MLAQFTTAVDPGKVPKRRLSNGMLMPCIGLGTFGSDKYGPAEIAEAVRGAAGRLPADRLRSLLRQRGLDWAGV